MAGYKELYINDIEELADVMVADIQEGHENVRAVLRYDEASGLIKELLRYDETSIVTVDCESNSLGDYSCEYVVTLFDNYGIYCEKMYCDKHGYYGFDDVEIKTYVFGDCNQKAIADLSESFVAAVMYEDDCCNVDETSNDDVMDIVKELNRNFVRIEKIMDEITSLRRIFV